MHRESMYHEIPEQAKVTFNAWFPLQNCVPENMMRYIPGSHLIPDEELLVRQLTKGDNIVKKGSFGHKLGFLYAPKEITHGINSKESVPFNLRTGEYVIFSAMLVHGCGINGTGDTRFSMSMAMIPEDKILLNKPYAAADGKPHFCKFNV